MDGTGQGGTNRGGAACPAVAVDSGELLDAVGRARRAADVVTEACRTVPTLQGEAVLPVGAFAVGDALSDLGRQWRDRLGRLGEALTSLEGAMTRAAQEYAEAEVSGYDRLACLLLPLPAGPPAPTSAAATGAATGGTGAGGR